MSNPSGWSRREYLKVSSLLGAGMIFGPIKNPYQANQNRYGQFIDSHVHVWTSKSQQYPMNNSYEKKDIWPSSFTAEEFFLHSKPSGVNRAVLVQMSFYGVDNRYMIDSIARFPNTFSGVARIDENTMNLGQKIKSLASAGIRGLRIHPGSQTIDKWLNNSGMKSLWRNAAEQGLAICPLINPDALILMGKMCKHYPDTRVVIDHCARINKNSIHDKQVDILCRLAKYTNVYVKISALHALGDNQISYLDLAPMIKKLCDAYGAERLMWGSDAPYQMNAGHRYEASIALIRDKIDFLSDLERQALLVNTAEIIFFNQN